MGCLALAGCGAKAPSVLGDRRAAASLPLEFVLASSYHRVADVGVHDVASWGARVRKV
jgi:hypothetical protein